MGSRRRVFPYIGAEKQPSCAYGSTEGGIVYLSSGDGHWQQFHTKCSLISSPQ